MRTIKGYITADGFAKVTAAEAYRHFIRMWGAEL